MTNDDPAGDEITLDDLCRVILDGYPFRRDGMVPVLRDHHRLALALLVREFGIEWHDDSEPMILCDQGLAAVFPTLLRTYPRHSTPYSSFLEYRFMPGEREVWHRHRERLADAAAAHRGTWVALLRDLLLLRWPEAATRRTSRSRLSQLGLGEEPDAADFL